MLLHLYTATGTGLVKILPSGHKKTDEIDVKYYKSQDTWEGLNNKKKHSLRTDSNKIKIRMIYDKR